MAKEFHVLQINARMGTVEDHGAFYDENAADELAARVIEMMEPGLDDEVWVVWKRSVRTLR